MRLIRYWLAAGAMPLVMTPELANTPSDADVLKDADRELLADEEAAGLYREEIVASASFVQHLSERGAGLAEGDGDQASPSIDEAYDDDEPGGEISRNSYRLPNVEWARFRYFDGNNWQAAWDSRVEGRLPVAVEMNLWLESRKKREAATEAAPRNASTRTTIQIARTSDDPADTWPESNQTREDLPEYPKLPAAPKETTIDDMPADGAFSELSDSGPMERRPEVRQLVVLRAAPPQPAAPSLDRAQFLGTPRRSLNLAPALQ